jgi:hypothetical protein
MTIEKKRGTDVKKVAVPLETGSKFFHCAFSHPCMMYG